MRFAIPFLLFSVTSALAGAPWPPVPFVEVRAYAWPNAVDGKHPEHAIAACFVPRNAFVFFNAKKKPVAFLEICFGCLNSRAGPQRPFQPIALFSLAAIFDELKLPMGEYPDLKGFKKHWGNVTVAGE